MKLSDSQKTNLRSLFEANGLNKDDIFTHRHFCIVTRAGIEKIQAKQGLDVTFEVIKCEPEFVVMKAHGRRFGDNERKVETFGSATTQNCTSKHLVEMAACSGSPRCSMMMATCFGLNTFR